MFGLSQDQWLCSELETSWSQTPSTGLLPYQASELGHLNHQGGCAADDRSGHTCSAQAHVGWRQIAARKTHDELLNGGISVFRYEYVHSRIESRQVRMWRKQRYHVVARGDDVGLYHLVKSRRTLRAVTRNHIASTIWGVRSFHCANSDHIRVVARCGDGSVTIRPCAVIAALIASRYYNHNSCFPS